MGNRRTITTRVASDTGYLRRRRSHVIKNRKSDLESKIDTMNNLLTLNGNLKKRSNVPHNAVSVSHDILASAGISLNTDTNRSKKSFSLIKQTNSNMIIKNPRILDITTYKNLPKKPVFANSVIKNQNDPFYKSDSVRSEFEVNKYNKRVRPPIDLSMVVIQAYETTTSSRTNTLRAYQGITKRGA